MSVNHVHMKMPQYASYANRSMSPPRLSSVKSNLYPKKKTSLLPTHRICFNCSFCAPVKLVGNLIFTPTTKSPRSLGFLDLGMPR